MATGLTEVVDSFASNVLLRISLCRASGDIRYRLTLLRNATIICRISAALAAFSCPHSLANWAINHTIIKTVINTTKTVNTSTDAISLASVLEKIINPDHMVKNKTINVDNSNFAKILCRAVGSLK